MPRGRVMAGMHTLAGRVHKQCGLTGNFDNVSCTCAAGWISAQASAGGSRAFGGAPGTRRALAWYPEAGPDTNVTVIITNVVCALHLYGFQTMIGQAHDGSQQAPCAVIVSSAFCSCAQCDVGYTRRAQIIRRSAALVMLNNLVKIWWPLWTAASC